jgi:ATP-dependent helicase HrpB
LPLGKNAEMPKTVLALEIHETAGAGQNRQVTIPVYLPCGPDLVAGMFPSECVWTGISEWDEKKKKVTSEERLMFRGISLAVRQPARDKDLKAGAAGVWAEKLASGAIRLSSYDERVEQLVIRLRLAGKYYPDLGFPAMNMDDWNLVYGELCRGKNSLEEIEKEPLYERICEYAGAELTSFLEKTFPVRRKMPNGKTGKIRYYEDRPPELSGRLGDFIGFPAVFSLCEGRLQVLFDILAPNYRTVQKTADLASFWKTAYPEIRKELKRKYPRHPWP